MSGALTRFLETLPDEERLPFMQELREKVLTNAETLRSPEEELDQELLARQEYRRLSARRAAERQLAAESYSGSTLLSWEDLDAKVSDWIIEGLLAAGSTNFVLAAPNLGKTFTVLDALLRCATGMPFLGATTRPARTLFVLGEGVTGFVERIDAWLELHDKTRADVDSWIRFVDGANLSSDTSIDLLRSYADDFDAELIVLDTWAATSGLAEENDNGVAADVLRRAREIKPGAALLITHHPRKSDEATDHPVMRGASALAGGADSIWAMYKDREFAASDGSGRDIQWLALSTDTAHGGKSRNAPAQTIRGLYLQTVGESAVLNVTETETASRASRAVLPALTRAGSQGITAQELAKQTGAEVRTVQRNLKAAVEEGHAQVTGTGKAGNPFRYFLASVVLVDDEAIFIDDKETD